MGPNDRRRIDGTPPSGAGVCAVRDRNSLMIPFADYCRQRGFSRQRGAQLRKVGRFGDSLIAQPHGKTSRYFVTSAEAADEALEQTAAGPRGLRGATAKPSNQLPKNNTPAPSLPPHPQVARSKKRKRIDDIEPEDMTRGQAIDAKAIYDAQQSKLKAAKLALEYDHASGKLILVADSERQVDTWTARVVAMVTSIPARVAQAGVPADVVERVRKEINRAREEIARTHDGS